MVKMGKLEIPYSVNLVCPDRWSASWDGKELRYQEFFDGDDAELRPIMARSKKLFKRLTLPDTQTRFNKNGMAFRHEERQTGTTALIGELVGQLEIQDRLSPGTMMEVVRLLERRRLFHPTPIPMVTYPVGKERQDADQS